MPIEKPKRRESVDYEKDLKAERAALYDDMRDCEGCYHQKAPSRALHIVEHAADWDATKRDLIRAREWNRGGLEGEVDAPTQAQENLFGVPLLARKLKKAK